MKLKQDKEVLSLLNESDFDETKVKLCGVLVRYPEYLPDEVVQDSFDGEGFEERIKRYIGFLSKKEVYNVRAKIKQVYVK